MRNPGNFFAEVWGNFFAEVPFWGKLLCRGLGKHIDKKNNMVLYRPYVYYMSFYYVNDTGFKYVNDIGFKYVNDTGFKQG